MKRMPISKFKEQCLALLDNLDDNLLIMKHGKVIAEVRPVKSASANLIGKYKNEISINGDIYSTGIHWRDDYCCN